jgi:hypothetical protein
MTDENVPFEHEQAQERLQAYARRKRVDELINSLQADTAHERRAYWSYREAIIWAVWRVWAAVPFSMDLWSVSCGGGAQTFLSKLGKFVVIHVLDPSNNKIELSPEGAHGRLMGALEAGELVALGAYNGELLKRAIPTHEWVGLSICDFAGMNPNVPDDRACRQGVPLWGDILFKRSDIERLFPPICSDGVEVVEAGEVAPVEATAVAKDKKYRLANTKDLEDLKALYKAGFSRQKAIGWGKDRGLSRETIYGMIVQVPAGSKKTSGGRKMGLANGHFF